MMVLDVMMIPHKYPNLTHPTHNHPTDSPYHPREADNGVSRTRGGGEEGGTMIADRYELVGMDMVLKILKGKKR